MKPVIRTEHLSKQFDLESGFFARGGKVVHAVQDVSFSIGRNETYGLVGESGCGKTTTARLLVGLYRPDGGRVLYTPASADNDEKSEGAQDIAHFSRKDLKQYREHIKYIFQDPARSLNPRMSVFQILTAGLRYSSLWQGAPNARQKAAQIISEVGLTPADLDRRPSDFSGGQRQRISIARGLIMEPEMLVCDEVVSALDVSIQGQILNLLQDIRERRGLSFLFIAHDLKVSSWFCDRIGVMYRGMLVEEGPAADLYLTAQHPYTRLLFDGSKGTAPVIAGEVKTVLEEEHGCPFAHRCPYVIQQCRDRIPDFSRISEDHLVRCRLAH